MEKGIAVQNVKEFYEFCSELEKEDRKQMIRESIMPIFSLSRKVKYHGHELLESLFFERMSYIKENLSNMKKTITIKVTLKGCEEEVIRIVQIPYNTNLADMVYILLASLHAYEKKEFLVEMKGKKYGCHQCQDKIDAYASSILLSEMMIQVHDNFTLLYDYDEQYIFHIEVQEIQNHHNIQFCKDGMIQYRKGFGIWEQAHELLNTYYHHHDQFEKMIQDDILDEQDYFMETMNDDVITQQQIEDYRISYELN